MLLPWLLIGFIGALALAWLACFPAARDAVARQLGRWMAALNRHTRRAGERQQRRLHAAANAVGGGGRRLGSDLHRHRRAIIVICILLVVPPVLVLALRQRVELDDYDSDSTAVGSNANLIASLLHGERLAPPPPLPPDVFVTREVEMIRPDLGGASRAWDKLDDDFRQRLLAVYKVMKEHYGYDMALLEGYRSPERQAQLSQQSQVVTNAGAYQSYHQYGLAADSAFYRDGKVVISEKDPWAMRGYRLYGQVAQEAGLVWGGNWKLMDFGHVEYHKPGAGPHARR